MRVLWAVLVVGCGSAPVVDLGVADAGGAVDALAPPADAAVAAAVDQATVMDASAPDLAIADEAAPDLVVLDLAPPPDLVVLDEARPDLVPPVDLYGLDRLVCGIVNWSLADCAANPKIKPECNSHYASGCLGCSAFIVGNMAGCEAGAYPRDVGGKKPLCSPCP